jgi:hypothetical protein
MLAAATPAQLAALAYDRLAGVPGVARVELAQALHFVKHDYRWSPAVAARAGAVPAARAHRDAPRTLTGRERTDSLASSHIDDRDVVRTGRWRYRADVPSGLSAIPTAAGRPCSVVRWTNSAVSIAATVPPRPVAT